MYFKDHRRSKRDTMHPTMNEYQHSALSGHAQDTYTHIQNWKETNYGKEKLLSMFTPPRQLTALYTQI